MTSPVLIVGGGPAGSVAALTLARQGIEVLLFEPTTGLGNKLAETLYPEAEALLRALGLSKASKVAASVSYVGLDGEAALTLSLSDRFAAIDRNELDHDFRLAAKAAGAGIVYVRIDGISVAADGVAVSVDDLLYKGSYLIDASGKNPVSVTGADQNVPSRCLDNRFNAFSHFTCPAGFNLKHRMIIALDSGFAYVLPIHSDRICVGITSYSASGADDVEETYHGQLAGCRFLSALTENAQRVLPVIPAKNLQTFNAAVAQGRILRAGDALGFRDPFLWDGLSFAIETGRAAAACCANAIAAGVLDHAAFSESVAELDHAIRQRTTLHYDRMAAQFNSTMAVDPHVSPVILGCLFSLTNQAGTSGLAGLRNELSARRSLR